MSYRLPNIFRFTCILQFSRVTGTCLIALICSPTFASEVLHYANTCVEQESGDVAGYVVIVQGGGARPWISLSWSEGSLKGPVTAKVTDCDRTSGYLVFSVHIEYGEFRFKGKIEPDRLEGTISSPWEASSEHLQLTVRPRKIAFEPEAECQ